MLNSISSSKKGGSLSPLRNRYNMITGGDLPISSLQRDNGGWSFHRISYYSGGMTIVNK